MALKILAQNALDAFSEPKTTEVFTDLVMRLEPDIAFFSEAYDADRAQAVDSALPQFMDYGYQVVYGTYDDADQRKDRQGLAMLVRRDLVVPSKSPRLMRVDGRTMAECWVVDPVNGQEVHFVGVHLNDRSEALRQAEVDDLLATVVQLEEPTIIAGDFNSLYKEHARGLVVRTARSVNRLVKLKLFPAPEPVVTTHPKKNLGRVGSLSKRLSEMASGQTMERLRAAGFTDADPKHRPTHPAARPFVQLDHILVSSRLRVQRFEILPRSTSDHLGIVAEITLD